MRGATLPLPQYAFMAWYLVKHRDNFTFYFWDKLKQQSVYAMHVFIPFTTTYFYKLDFHGIFIYLLDK
jgi:hypothetical protein